MAGSLRPRPTSLGEDDGLAPVGYPEPGEDRGDVVSHVWRDIRGAISALRTLAAMKSSTSRSLPLRSANGTPAVGGYQTQHPACDTRPKMASLAATAWIARTISSCWVPLSTQPRASARMASNTQSSSSNIVSISTATSGSTRATSRAAVTGPDRLERTTRARTTG